MRDLRVRLKSWTGPRQVLVALTMLLGGGL